ncbi:MAG: FecR domain-containing protein [Saprospiraceae bacterium]
MKKEFNNLQDFIEDVSFNKWMVEKSEKDGLVWKEWLAKHPEKKELLEDAASILTGIQFNASLPSSSKVEAQLKLLHSSIAAKEAAYQQPKQIRSSLRRKSIWSIAAAIALLLTMTFVIPYFLPDTIIEHQTAFGELKDIQLPDGSKIALNANSTLKYESDSPRKVWLEGEAFFEVTKRPETGENFQVLTNDLTVEVLGTIFNVKNRNQETKVFLEEGKVVLALDKQIQQTIEMLPGDLVSYAKNQQKTIEKVKAKAIDNTSWKDGVIRFNEASLAETIAEISAIYGIQFKVKDNEVKEELAGGGVPIGNRAIMLETLKDIYKVEIVEEDGVYVISRK